MKLKKKRRKSLFFGSIYAKILTTFIATGVILSLFGILFFFQNAQSQANMQLTDVINFSKESTDQQLREYFQFQLEETKQNLVFTSIILGIMLIVLLIIISIIIGKYITKPLDEILRVIKELGSGNYKARAKVSSGDELEDIGNTLNKSISILQKLELEKTKIESAKTKFLTITTHELRSPMTPIKAELQILGRGYYGKLNKKQKESMKVVMSNTDRLDSIIRDLLDVSRMEAARLKFDFQKTDLNRLLLKMSREKYSRNKIQIKVKAKKLPIIECDPMRVEQILTNLLSNASKFVEGNGKIEISAEEKRNYIQFSVKDNGIGIHKKDQMKIFEPFFQAETTLGRRYQGTGLGLTVTKGIVQLQKGKIWLKSKPGVGTKIYFTIPKKPVRHILPLKITFTSSEKEILETKKAEKDISKFFEE